MSLTRYQLGNANKILRCECVFVIVSVRGKTKESIGICQISK